MSGGARTLRCVVLDVDDTLYLERDYARSGLRHLDGWVRRRYGVAGFGETSWRLFQEGVRGRIFDEALAELGVRPGAGDIQEMVAAYRAHAPVIELLPDARRALDALSRTVRLAALTGGPEASQRAKVEALGLGRWIDPIVLTAELGPDAEKPSPAGFQEIERRTGLRGSACVYVGDNPAKDLQAPRALGWHTIRIRRPGSLHEDRPSGPLADREVADLDAVVRWVTGAPLHLADPGC